MAVYTQVDDQTLSHFLSSYDIGEAISFKGIAEGVENSNYLLETTKGRYILTLYEKRTDPADLPYFLNLMEHLVKKGINAPLPIRDKNGAALQTLAGRPACIISFLTGVSIDHPKAAHCAELGKILAEMHLALADFGEDRANSLTLAGWKSLVEQTAARADEVSSGLEKTLKDEIAALESQWPDNLPSGAIHADLFPDNVLFTKDKITGLIDFYFACSDSYAYDLAVCINAWCFNAEHAFQEDCAAALTEAYQSVRPLNEGEKHALPLLCRGAALRFLLTRLYDWLNPVEGAVVKMKDPTEYLKKLRFHQDAENERSYGL